MNYLRDKRIKKKRRVPWIILWMVLVFLALVVFTPLYDGIGKLFHQLGAPVWYGGEGVRQLATQGSQRLQSKSVLIDDNNELREALHDAEIQLFQLDLMKKENEELKNVLGHRPPHYQVTLASVLSRPPRTLYDTFIIDAGEQDNIRIGDPVVVSGVVFLGTVGEVYQNTSRVDMLSSPNSEKSIEMIVAEHNMFVEVIGLGGGNFEFHVPQETQIEDGNLLLIPGPDHFVSGRIEAIVFDPRDPFQIVRARTPVNIQHLNLVQVLSPPVHE